MVRGRIRVAAPLRAPAARGWLLATILSGSLVAACGQRGPLVLPSPPAEPPARVRAPSSGTVIVPPARRPARPDGGSAGEGGGAAQPAPSGPARTD